MLVLGNGVYASTIFRSTDSTYSAYTFKFVPFATSMPNACVVKVYFALVLKSRLVRSWSALEEVVHCRLSMGGWSSIGSSVLWLLLLALTINVPLPAMARHQSGVQVNLRIEGGTGIIFEGAIETHAQNVTTASGGTHQCDGTNGHAHPTPGPTPTTALADAASADGFTFDGTYNTEFDDFLITRIGASVQNSTHYWFIFVNYEKITVGGCQFQVRTGDDVLWAFLPFKTAFLEPSGIVRSSED